MGSVVALLVSSPAAQAEAYEGQWREGITAGANLSPRMDVGPQAGLYAAYGWAPSWDVRFEALGSLHPDDAARRDLVRVGVGVLYKLDITQWIPYLGLGGAYAWVIEPASSGAVIEPFLGLDYLWSRSVAFGIEYRVAAFDDDALRSPVQQLMVHVEHRWGF